jgi:hypothetical protein
LSADSGVAAAVDIAAEYNNPEYTGHCPYSVGDSISLAAGGYGSPLFGGYSNADDTEEWLFFEGTKYVGASWQDYGSYWYFYIESPALVVPAVTQDGDWLTFTAPFTLTGVLALAHSDDIGYTFIDIYGSGIASGRLHAEEDAWFLPYSDDTP